VCEVCAAEPPPDPLATRSSPAMTLKVAVWVCPMAMVETPLPRCRPQRGRRTALLSLIAVRMSRLTHSLLAPFDTSCGGRRHSPRGNLYRPKTVQRVARGPQIAFLVLFLGRRRRAAGSACPHIRRRPGQAATVSQDRAGAPARSRLACAVRPGRAPRQQPSPYGPANPKGRPGSWQRLNHWH
jgi:hypothetical protein